MSVPSVIKSYAHLRPSHPFEQLDQIQEKCHLSRQVVKCKEHKCGYLGKAYLNISMTGTKQRGNTGTKESRNKHQHKVLRT